MVKSSEITFVRANSSWGISLREITPPHFSDQHLPFLGKHVVDENLAGVGMGRVRGKRERMNILGDKRHRRGIDGRAAILKAQHLGVINKADTELAGGNHLRDQDLGAAKV